MSGSEFVDVLRKLSYPGVKSLDGPSLDWLFENEVTSPFLDWFCNELQPTNLLTAREVAEYVNSHASVNEEW